PPVLGPPGPPMPEPPGPNTNSQTTQPPTPAASKRSTKIGFFGTSRTPSKRPAWRTTNPTARAASAAPPTTARTFTVPSSNAAPTRTPPVMGVFFSRHPTQSQNTPEGQNTDLLIECSPLAERVGFASRSGPTTYPPALGSSKPWATASTQRGYCLTCRSS